MSVYNPVADLEPDIALFALSACRSVSDPRSKPLRSFKLPFKPLGVIVNDHVISNDIEAQREVSFHGSRARSGNE